MEKAAKRRAPRGGAKITRRILFWLTILLVLLLVGMYVIFQISKNMSARVSVERARLYTVDDSELMDGLFVRNESIIESNQTGVVTYTLAEGERVPKSGEIAQLFDNIDVAKMQAAITQTEREIAALTEAGEKSGTAAVPVDVLDKSINESLFTLLNVMGEQRFGALEDAKRSLLLLLNKRQIVTGRVQSFDARIDELKATLATLKEQCGRPMQTITSTEAGYFSSCVDGYEGLVDLLSLPDITVSQISDLLHMEPPEPSPRAIGRITPTAEWYYLCVLPPERVQNMQVGSVVTMLASDLTASEIPMTAHVINEEPNGSAAVVFRSTRIIPELFSLRTAPVTLRFSSYKGLRVSSRAIRFSGEQMGVYILEGTVARFAKIEPLYTGDTFVICKQTDEKGALALYDDVIVEGRDLYDGKIVRPDIS